MPVVRRVEEAAAVAAVCGHRCLGRRLARPWDKLDRCAVSRHLDCLGGRGGGRRHDGRGKASGCGIRRDRRATVARAVLEHLGKHHRGAAVLERARWIEPLALEVDSCVILKPTLEQRRAALSEGDRVGAGDREGCRVAPERAHRPVDLLTRDSRQRSEHERLLAKVCLSAPHGRIKRKKLAALGLDVAAARRAHEHAAQPAS
eukprot:scaffold128341_cov32-Tisochrysis_lutea.AAC.3